MPLFEFVHKSYEYINKWGKKAPQKKPKKLAVKTFCVCQKVQAGKIQKFFK
jgi:hypothetical protein